MASDHGRPGCSGRAQCGPVGEYACELWEGEISETWSDKLESVQYSYCVAAMGLHGHPSAAGVRAEMELVEWRMRRKGLKLRWWGRMCQMPRERLVSLLFRRRHAELLRGGARCSGLRSARDLLLECDFDDAWQNRTAGDGGDARLVAVDDAVQRLAETRETAEFGKSVSAHLCQP